MSKIVEEQGAPAPNAETPVWDLVVADMKARDAVGRERYGTPLQPFNGRKALVDAYQEILDLAVYVRQEIAEREALEKDLFEARQALIREGVARNDLARAVVDSIQATRAEIADWLEVEADGWIGDEGDAALRAAASKLRVKVGSGG